MNQLFRHPTRAHMLLKLFFFLLVKTPVYSIFISSVFSCLKLLIVLYFSEQLFFYIRNNALLKFGIARIAGALLVSSLLLYCQWCRGRHWRHGERGCNMQHNFPCWDLIVDASELMQRITSLLFTRCNLSSRRLPACCCFHNALKPDPNDALNSVWKTNSILHKGQLPRLPHLTLQGGCKWIIMTSVRLVWCWNPQTWANEWKNTH